jgi:hypothetical protein
MTKSPREIAREIVNTYQVRYCGFCGGCIKYDLELSSKVEQALIQAAKQDQVSDEELDKLAKEFEGNWPEGSEDATSFKAGFKAAQEMNAVKQWPSEEEVAKKALEICFNEPERVTQQKTKEEVTRKFYDWLKERMCVK